MSSFTTTRYLLLLQTLLFSTVLHGQAVSPVNITTNSDVSLNPYFHIPLGDGTIHYDLMASEMLENGAGITGGGSSWDSMANAGGDLSYTSKSVSKPFNLLYSGGYYWTSIPGMSSTTYQNLTLSQGIVHSTWSLGLSDTFSYLPSSPTFGISGIPGVGDMGLQTGQSGSGPAPTLLTNYSTMITNTISGTGNHKLDYNTSISLLGSWSVMRFLGNAGLNNTQLNGIASLNRVIDARSTAGINYEYSDFTYQSYSSLNFTTQGVNFFLQRQWSRPLSMSISVGPQWVYGANQVLFPTQINISASADISYTKKHKSATIGYSRGAMSGVGVLPGAFENSVQASYQNTYGKNWMSALTATYMQTSGFGNALPGSAISGSNGNIDSEYSGIQITRRLGRDFSTFASYTVENQTYPQSLSTQNAFSGFGQIVSIGVSFSPRSAHLGQL